MTRMLTLLLFLMPMAAGAQFGERALGGPDCFKVATVNGEHVSSHTRATKALTAAATAQSLTGVYHFYSDDCAYLVSTPGMDGWPDLEPGAVLAQTGLMQLVKGVQPGTTVKSVRLQFSPDGVTWLPVTTITGPGILLEGLPDKGYLRLVGPATAGSGN